MNLSEEYGLSLEERRGQNRDRRLQKAAILLWYFPDMTETLKGILKAQSRSVILIHRINAGNVENFSV